MIFGYAKEMILTPELDDSISKKNKQLHEGSGLPSVFDTNFENGAAPSKIGTTFGGAKHSHQNMLCFIISSFHQKKNPHNGLTSVSPLLKFEKRHILIVFLWDFLSCDSTLW